MAMPQREVAEGAGCACAGADLPACAGCEGDCDAVDRDAGEGVARCGRPGRRRGGGIWAVVGLHQFREPAEGGGFEGVDLGFDGGGVFRQVTGEGPNLAADDAAEGEQDADGDGDHEQHGGDSPEMHAAEQRDQRHQQEGEQQGQGDRDEDFTAEIEGDDDHDEQRHDFGGIGRGAACAWLERDGRKRWFRRCSHW
nr:hypothetical protein [Acidiphilium sp. 34-64-41]